MRFKKTALPAGKGPLTRGIKHSVQNRGVFPHWLDSGKIQDSGIACVYACVDSRISVVDSVTPSWGINSQRSPPSPGGLFCARVEEGLKKINSP